MSEDGFDGGGCDLDGWGLTSLPYYTVHRLKKRGGKGRREVVGAVFSTREIARSYIRSNGLAGRGWRVGKLATWEEVLRFMEDYASTKYISLDSKKVSSPESCVVVDITTLLPLLRELAAQERLHWAGEPLDTTPFRLH